MEKPARKTHRAQSRMGLHDEHNFHCVTLLPRGSEFMAHCVISRIVQPSDVLNQLVFQYIKFVARGGGGYSSEFWIGVCRKGS